MCDVTEQLGSVDSRHVCISGAVSQQQTPAAALYVSLFELQKLHAHDTDDVTVWQIMVIAPMRLRGAVLTVVLLTCCTADMQLVTLDEQLTVWQNGTPDLHAAQAAVQ